MYISNKIEHFSYKDGCGICGHHMRIEAFKRMLVQATLWVISNKEYIILFKTVVSLRKLRMKSF